MRLIFSLLLKDLNFLFLFLAARLNYDKADFCYHFFDVVKFIYLLLYCCYLYIFFFVGGPQLELSNIDDGNLAETGKTFTKIFNLSNRKLNDIEKVS